MNPPPIYYYEGFAIQNGRKEYLGMTPAVGKNQAKTRILADWQKAAPQLIQDINSGKVRMIVRRTGIKMAKKASNIPSQPKKTWFFDVFGERTKVRMELPKKNRGE